VGHEAGGKLSFFTLSESILISICVINYCVHCTVNSSTLKRTLRINNRDLARALELKKLELHSAQNLIMKLRTENQSLLHEKVQLRTSSNVQSDFEQEVNRRVNVSIKLDLDTYLS